MGTRLILNDATDEIKEEVEGESLKDFITYYPLIKRKSEELSSINNEFFGGEDKLDNLKTAWEEINS